MEIIHIKITVITVILIWLLACMFIYRSFRHASWLAGSTVSSCLFFLGVTVATSFLVNGALYLMPLWLGIIILLIAHLFIAGRTRTESSFYPDEFDRISSCKKTDPFI